MSERPNRTLIPSWAGHYPEVAQTVDQLRLPFYCCNCMRKRETRYITPNFGPFCDDCLKEVEPLLKKDIAL